MRTEGTQSSGDGKNWNGDEVVSQELEEWERFHGNGKDWEQ